MKRKSIKTNQDRWEQGFAALCKFRRRMGHCCPPERDLEGKYNLAAWVVVQHYRKEDLSVERKHSQSKRRLRRWALKEVWEISLQHRGLADP
jgi:hypothetical protein